MYLLKVIPIANKLPEKYFSYFSLAKIKAGSLVEIKIKNRKVSGIITEVSDVKSEKINLKGENFSLKKIERVLKENFIDENIINSLNQQSFLLGIKESDVLENFLVDDLFEKIININLENLPSLKLRQDTVKNNNQNETKKEEKNNKSEAIIADQKSRIEEYLEKIKKEFKKGNSVAIFSPTINDLKNLLDKLEKIINNTQLENNLKENIIIFHGDQKKKEREENLNKLDKEGSKIFLSTPSIFPFLIKDQFNLNLIIIDKENSFSYFSYNAKKEIDTRELIKNIAMSAKIKTLQGGEIFSLNTFKSIKENKIKLLDLKEKSENKKILIFDLAKEKEKTNTKYSSVYFKKEVIEKLEDYKEKGEGKIFLYTKRKGIAGEIICKDCNHILKCESCDKPYILFKENINGKREYMCAICKNKKEIPKDENLSCSNCGSWRMDGVGIGSEGLEENLKENGFKVFIIDAKNTNTKTKIKKVIEDWQNEKLAVLVGTDLALNNLNENHKMDFAGIISIDTLFSIPEINIDEKIINLIIDFKEKCKTKSKLFIETRLRDADIWKYIEENNYLGFLEVEYENRKMLNLPPFSNILKFKLGNKNTKYKDRIENLLLQIQKEENVREEKINWRKENKTGDYIGMLMINKNEWENLNENKEIIATNFAKKINTLLSDFNLEINPQNVYK